MLFQASGKHLHPGSVKRGRNSFAFISRHVLSVEGKMDLLTTVKGKDRMLSNPHFHMSFRYFFEVSLLAQRKPIQSWLSSMINMSLSLLRYRGIDDRFGEVEGFSHGVGAHPDVLRTRANYRTKRRSPVAW
jgi:hypothetical protein